MAKDANKDDKKKKPVGGLMGGLIQAGFLTQKGAREIKREVREERKAIRNTEGPEGLKELERRNAAERERSIEVERARQRESDAAARKEQEKDRVRELLRDRIGGAGNRTYFFVRPDRWIDYVEVDDMTSRRLRDGEAFIARSPEAGPGVYLVLATSRLEELRKLAPELILAPTTGG